MGLRHVDSIQSGADAAERKALKEEKRANEAKLHRLNHSYPQAPPLSLPCDRKWRASGERLLVP